MPDLEKVINGLERCTTGGCNKCPYYGDVMCTTILKGHALELLREQIFIKWIPCDPDSRGYTDKFSCSGCGYTVHLGWCVNDCDFNYCPECGKKAKRDA